MKITAVKSFPVKVGHRNKFIVKVETDAGSVRAGRRGHLRTRAGDGRAWSPTSHRCCSGWTRAGSSTSGRPSTGEPISKGGKILGAAVSAIDIALWDILGQGAGRAGLAVAGRGLPRAHRVLRDARLADRSAVRRTTRSRRSRPAGGFCASDRACPDTDWTGGDGAILRAAARRFRSRGALDSRSPHGRRAGDRPLDRLPSPALGRRGGALLQHDRRRTSLVPGGADPRPEPEGVPAIAHDDADAVRDRRGVLQQVGVRALHRGRDPELRADGRLQRRRADRSEEDCRLVRGALHRPDAPQPARRGLHRRLDPLRRRDAQHRATRVLRRISRPSYPRDLFPDSPEVDGSILPAARPHPVWA